MFDFLKVVKTYQRERYHYKPTFIVKSSVKDIMTRGGVFYAIFDEETGFWTKSKPRAIELIDQQVKEYAAKDAGPESMADPSHGPIVQSMADTSNLLSTQFDRFCKTMGDNWIALDQKMIFSNTEVKKSDYASKALDYPLTEAPTPYYDALCSVLYSPDEQEKWEWAVGAMIASEQNKIQKMFAFYGEPGTGKSTVISKIFAEQIFGGLDMGYAVKFEANNVVGGDSFGTDFLENDSVLVYDDDAEMGVISCRSTLNKIISHESIRVNCKFKTPFMTKSNCMIFVGSNDPIQLSPNSGMKRRLIDIRPTGVLVDPETYDNCMEHIPFEKSGIAWKCLQVYKTKGRHYYDHYVAEDMLNRTSPFHNFVVENVMQLKDGVSLAKAYDLYVAYAESCKFKNIVVRYKFRDTLKLYFDTYDEARFEGFRWEKIGKERPKPISIDISSWLNFDCASSRFDKEFSDMPAQYANEEGTPSCKWEKCKTVLNDLDTSKLHYVKMPIEHIVIDFDIKGEDGNKSFEKNYEAASKFPPTYAELSKSGCGIHLHYIYTGGDPNELSRMFDDNVEIKVFNGNSSLRRCLTFCNDLPIATLASGLPFKEVKGGKDVLDEKGFKNETKLKHTIVKAMRNCDPSPELFGKVMPNLTPSHKCTIDFIDMLLKDAYHSGKTYDCRDLQQSIITFALASTNKSEYCLDLVSNMHFCSKDIEEMENPIDTPDYIPDDNREIVFFDVEIAPSYKQYVEYCEKNEIEINASIPKDTPAHFLICYKFKDKDEVYKLLDPKPEEVEKLFSYGLIGFNNRSYDNHMCYAASQGYSSEELYELNCKIIGDKFLSKKSKFGQAYNLSKTDILDFATNKQGLKKYEIDMGIRHLEWDRPWYEPIPKDRLESWCDYCTNDVVSTEKVFYYLEEDYEARQILAAISGGTENDTTNTLTTKLLTNGIDNPQSDYIYTDLSTIFPGYRYDPAGIPIEEYSTEPGTKVSTRKSIYLGEDPSEGGFANCPEPGIYYNVGLLDIASMHPHSAIALKIFGDVITKRFEALVEARVSIKHIKEIGDEYYNRAIKYLETLKEGSSKVMVDALAGLEGTALKAKCKAIANALKIAINSVYGLTSAKFDNALRDPKNVDNIVAKYGALFMITLKHEVQKMGYTVVHIKTDSIKIANFDDKIKEFCMDFAKKYGFTFEHEATYDRICIVDDAQYIAYEVEADGEKLDNPFWTVTGAKFAAPYLFKSLFSHEEIDFKDYCETKAVSGDASIHLYSDSEDKFVGRVGSFVCTTDGGELMRVQGSKVGAVTGTKGTLWSEAVDVESNPERINKDYYRMKIDEAVDCINQYGSFDDFINVA